MEYEPSIQTIRATDVINKLKVLHIARSLLAHFPYGTDGWGDCGHATWEIVAGTNPGSLYAEHKYYKEDEVHYLRHAISIKRPELKNVQQEFVHRKPADIRSRNEIHSESNKLAGSLTVSALVRIGFVESHAATGTITIPPSSYAAICYQTADITHRADRAVYDLLDDYDVAEELNSVTIQPLMPGESENKFDHFWRSLSATIAENSLT